MDTVDRLALVALAGAATLSAAGSDPVGGHLAAPLLIGGVATDREGLGVLVAWIVGGAAVGAAAGYGATMVATVPLTVFGATGLGAAVGGGLGGLTYFLWVGEQEIESDPAVTVDMGSDEDPDPRPADLFEDHPDPVLYVADEGGGPAVRAANDAYGETFDLPPATLSGTPLAEALRPVDDADDLVAALADGEAVDRELAFETADGTGRFRVRSVGSPADGYLLFTPL